MHTWHLPDLRRSELQFETAPDRTIDSATKYCQGAPSISAFFAEMGGNRCHCFLAGSIKQRNTAAAKGMLPSSKRELKRLNLKIGSEDRAPIAHYCLRHRNPSKMFLVTRVCLSQVFIEADLSGRSARPIELSLTNRARAETISRLHPSECGPVAQLGARFHGMEEVIGSIPIRSTNKINDIQKFHLTVWSYLRANS
jgi:hypothetical protein